MMPTSIQRRHSSSRPPAGGAQLRVSDPQRPSRASAPGHSARRRGSYSGFLPGRKGPTVPDNVVLIMRFHPVGGEDVSVISEDFTGDHEALEAVGHALDQRRRLGVRHAREEPPTDENWILIHPANTRSGRASRADSAATGQYL